MKKRRRNLLKALGGFATLSGAAKFLEKDDKGPGKGMKELDSIDDFHKIITPEHPEIKEIAADINIGTFTDLTLEFPERVEFEPSSDQKVYGEKDKWASPADYIKNDFHGDCEDYAAFTTSVLLSRDVPARCVFDLREGKEHAVTEIKFDGSYWITGIKDPGECYPREEYAGGENGWEPVKMAGAEKVTEYRENW